MTTARVNAVEAREIGGDLCTRLIEESGQPVYGCYQCQRCGGGCPVAEAAGTTPNQFLRLLALGLIEEAAQSPLVWLCVGCSACGARCPNKISTNEVIDRLRALAPCRWSDADDTWDARVFHRLFLTQTRYLGRQYELLLLAALNVLTLRPFKDLDLGYRMFRRGKISLLPHSVTGIPGVRAIFRRRARRR